MPREVSGPVVPQADLRIRRGRAAHPLAFDTVKTAHIQCTIDPPRSASPAGQLERPSPANSRGKENHHAADEYDRHKYTPHHDEGFIRHDYGPLVLPEVH